MAVCKGDEKYRYGVLLQPGYSHPPFLGTACSLLHTSLELVVGRMALIFRAIGSLAEGSHATTSLQLRALQHLLSLSSSAGQLQQRAGVATSSPQSHSSQDQQSGQSHSSQSHSSQEQQSGQERVDFGRCPPCM